MKFSLRMKTVLLIVLIAFILSTVSTVVSRQVIRKLVDKSYQERATDVSETIAAVLDVEKAAWIRNQIMAIFHATDNKVTSDDWGSPEFDAYIALYSHLEETEEYQYLRRQMRTIQDVNDVDCVYLSALDIPTEYFIYLVDAAYEDVCPPGCIDPLYEVNRELLDDPSIGFLPYITNTEAYGWLITAGVPVYDAEGNIICYAMVDVSMDHIRAQQFQFTLVLSLILAALTVLISLLSIWAVNKAIIRPINLLSGAAAHYSAQQEDSSELDRLPIKSKDEIQSLYSSLLKMAENTRSYIDSLKETKKELTQTRIEADEMNELAHRDALTGVGSKLAYDQQVTGLTEEIRQGGARFGIVMVDMNDLKKLNDTYGHERGNDAIRTACAVICDVFAHSPVYRFGGDEFVVVVKGRDYDHIEERVRQFRLAARAADGQPWEKVNAAIGYALYSGEDTVDDVFRAADHRMYEQKKKMKSQGEDDSGESGTNQALEEEHKNAALYDYLTGLPNMSYFFELAEIGRQAMLDQGGLPALLYIDLRGMKTFNHKYGFSEGDKLLQHFAGLLSRTFGPDRCAHINADRFAAFADENGLKEQLHRMFQEWREMNHSMHLPVCVGVYPHRIEAVPAGRAFDRAKIACDAIQGAYFSSFNYFNKAMSEEIIKQQYILETFERALNENWIQVYYQPIVRAINRKVCDEEALARWIDPEKGLLQPAEFIPYLEDAGLIYRLDLHMLEKVLENMKAKEAEGLYIVPHSINLSRSDFDACDMVEEVRRRVDEAGVSRDKICIEITESVIGSDFDYMKVQIERFQALGFPVWMDDFGSGYSSLDVLQSIKFDLLKFDMTFMRKLDENDDGRIILTELMKMATALGVDTICEGVETEEQAHFLQEIGCSKLQGFFFSKAVPLESALEYHKAQKLAGYENPEESAYYELICGLNLYDVGVVARDEKNSLQNTYSTLPMCIIEVKGDSTRFVRTNQSYRDFFIRFFALDPSNLGPEFGKYDAAFMYNVVKTCCEQGIRTFYDEKMPDGSIVHSFARRIGVNPVTGATAVAIAVLSVREPNEKLMTEQILTVIEQFGKHMPGGFYIYQADEGEKLLYANEAVFSVFGCDSLEDFKAYTGFTFRGMVHPEDYGRVSASIRDQIEISRVDVDSVEYRIIRKDGGIRWIGEYGHYVEYEDGGGLYYVFLSDITDKHEQAESDKAMRSAVIEALTKAYDSVWLIRDIETEKFELFRIDKETEHLMPANSAMKIEKFSQAFAFYSKLVMAEDRGRFLEAVAPESIVRNTETMLIYSVPFRRVFENDIRHYRVEFARLDLPGGKTGIVCGFKDVDKETRKDQ